MSVILTQVRVQPQEVQRGKEPDDLLAAIAGGRDRDRGWVLGCWNLLAIATLSLTPLQTLGAELRRCHLFSKRWPQRHTGNTAWRTQSMTGSSSQDAQGGKE